MQIARAEVSVVRGKHEFIGDGRNKSSNNKLKSLRAAPYGPNPWLVCVASKQLVPSACNGKWRQFMGRPVRKYVLETYFLIRTQGSGGHFYSKRDASCTALVGGHGFDACSARIFLSKTELWQPFLFKTRWFVHGVACRPCFSCRHDMYFLSEAH